MPDTFAELPGSPDEKWKEQLLWPGGWVGPGSSVPATILGPVKGTWLADACPWSSHSPLITWVGGGRGLWLPCCLYFPYPFLGFSGPSYFLWCLLVWVSSLKFYRVLKWGGLDCSNGSGVFKGKFCLAEAKTWCPLFRTSPCCMQMVRKSFALDSDAHVGRVWEAHPGMFLILATVGLPCATLHAWWSLSLLTYACSPEPITVPWIFFPFYYEHQTRIKLAIVF